MKEVTKEEFYSTIGRLDVHPRKDGSYYPYVSVFLSPSGVEVGRIVPVSAPSEYPVTYKYFIN